MSTPSSDWRYQLQLHEREKVIGKIMETFKNKVKESDATSNLKEMLRIAVQFEEATYAAAISMDDYLRKISTKLIYVETMNQPSAPTNPELTTSASRPSPQINPNFSSSASDVSGLPKFGFMYQNHRHAGFPVIHSNINNFLQVRLPASESTSTYASNSQNTPGMLQSSINNSIRLQQQSQNSLKYNQIVHSQMLNRQLHHFSLSYLQMQQQQQSTWPLMSSNLQSSPSNPYPNLNPNHQLCFGRNMLFPRSPHQEAMSMQKNAIQGQGLDLQSNLLKQDTQKRHPLLHFRSAINRLPFDQKESRNTGAADWQEAGYQKLQSMKEQYLTELNEVREKIKLKLQQLESLVPSEQHAEQFQTLNNLIVKLDRAIIFLMLSKDKITVNILERISGYEEHISKFLSQYKQRKIAQANQPHEIKLEVSETSSIQNISTCATNTLKSNVGRVQARSSLSQSDSTTELNYLRMKHRSSTDPRVYEYSAGQRRNYYNQLVKKVVPCQNVLISLPQYCQNSSPKIEDDVTLSSSLNSKLPTESARSPLVDTEKRKSAPSLLVESYSQDGNQGAVETSKSSVTKRPIDCLIKSFQSLEHEYLHSAIGSIESLVAMNDMISISRCGYGYEGNIIEDIAEMTNYCPRAKKMKRDITVIPKYVSSVGSVNDEFMQMHGFISSEVKSTETSHVKGIKFEINRALIEEIREINRKQIDLVLEVSEDTDFDVVTSEYRNGNVVKCSYSTVSLCSDLKARLCSSQMNSMMPLRLWVPPEYPKCSPFPMSNLTIEPNKELEAIYTKARSRFERSACCLSEPISVKDMVNTWGACVREAILEYAEKLGGGTFSSIYGSWEYCVDA